MKLRLLCHVHFESVHLCCCPQSYFTALSYTAVSEENHITIELILHRILCTQTGSYSVRLCPNLSTKNRSCIGYSCFLLYLNCSQIWHAFVVHIFTASKAYTLVHVSSFDVTLPHLKKMFSAQQGSSEITWNYVYQTKIKHLVNGVVRVKY